MKTYLLPPLQLQYLSAYLLFTWFCTGFILTHYAGLFRDVVPLGGPYREYFICGGQIVFQGAVLSLIATDKKWIYLGNMMTISFGGAILLVPGLFVAYFISLPQFIYVLYFMAVAGLMFLEHIRRAGLLRIGYVPTISWVFYRIVVLLFILLV